MTLFSFYMKTLSVLYKSDYAKMCITEVDLAVSYLCHFFKVTESQ